MLIEKKFYAPRARAFRRVRSSNFFMMEPLVLALKSTVAGSPGLPPEEPHCLQRLYVISILDYPNPKTRREL
jgi:hypothetical protein